MGREWRGVKPASASSIEISFQYQGRRCRERIKLEPTPANLKRAERHKIAIEEAIRVGTFDYTKTFPNSPRAKLYNQGPGAGLDVGEYLERWWKIEKDELKASTRAVDKRTLFNQIIPEFGHLALTELTWKHIREWVRDQNWSHKTQNNKLSLLRRALNEAVELELIDHHPMMGKMIRKRKTRAATVRPQRDAIDPFDHAEREALVKTASGQLHNLIQFNLWTGLRLSELFALSWENVDWVHGRIYIEGALTQQAKDIESTKTEAGERTVELLPPALAALKAQKDHTFLAGNEIFQNPYTGKRWTGDLALRARQWRTLLKRAGVRWRPPGQMRHTFASMMLMARESPQWVAAMMGHRDWTFTARTYYRWIPKDADGAGSKALQKWDKRQSESG
jgi:integrase